MSTRTPPTLRQLAAESLLRDQASAIAALEYLPAELFPRLFTLAYRDRRHQVLKAITQAWPFSVLPLGYLSQLSHEVFKAVLDGLDLLLAQDVRPRRCKLRVLDLRKLGADFWRMWLGDSTKKRSLTGPPAVHRSSPNMEHPLAPVEVFLDLNFNKRNREKFFMYVIQWAQQREGLVHLCCKTLRIAEVPFQRLRKVLDAVQLHCIQEVEVKCTWDLPTLEMFALYLGQMRNLQRLSLSYIHMFAGEEEDEEEEQEEQEEEEEEESEWERVEQESFHQFLSQILRMQHLRELHLNSPCFLLGRLDQLLRCLQTPLDRLSITNCRHLMHSDLIHLFQCPKIRQLKSLHLSALSLKHFNPEPLRALLEAVAPTLQVLGLVNCAMVDSQVEVILPVLSCCHQLTELTISENDFSLTTVEKLLRHTARLCNLELELYPVPRECYTTWGTLRKDRLVLVRAELKGILRELGQPRTICLGTNCCGQCGKIKFYNVEFS